MNPVNFKTVKFVPAQNTPWLNLHDGPCWIGQIYVNGSTSGSQMLISDYVWETGGDAPALLAVVFTINTGKTTEPNPASAQEGVRQYTIPAIPGGGYHFANGLSVKGDSTGVSLVIQYYPL